MRSIHFVLNAALIAAAVCTAAAQSGGNYAIKDATVEGSAHESTGGTFTIETRLGQGLAGPALTGGAFSVGGGFFPAPPPPTTLTSPNAPSDLTAGTVTATSVSLSWTDNSSNEDGFKIERCTVAGKRCKDYIVIATLGSDAVSFDDRAVMKNTGYQYQLRAFNSAGESPLSNVLTVKTAKR
jgi:hypothetical protein